MLCDSPIEIPVQLLFDMLFPVRILLLLEASRAIPLRLFKFVFSLKRLSFEESKKMPHTLFKFVFSLKRLSLEDSMKMPRSLFKFVFSVKRLLSEESKKMPHSLFVFVLFIKVLLIEAYKAMPLKLFDVRTFAILEFNEYASITPTLLFVSVKSFTVIFDESTTPTKPASFGIS